MHNIKKGSDIVIQTVVDYGDYIEVQTEYSEYVPGLTERLFGKYKEDWFLAEEILAENDNEGFMRYEFE